LSDKQLAYVHVSDGTGAGWHAKLRPRYKGIYFAGAGFTRESSAEFLERGGADAIVYGTKFLANPDLPERFKRDAPLNEPDQSTLYSSDERGYTDYPTLERITKASTA
jgi:N-ethylmaleimide reductase